MKVEQQGVQEGKSLIASIRGFDMNEKEGIGVAPGSGDLFLWHEYLDC